MSDLVVAAAAVIRDDRLLVVSKRAAPDVFYLPGGKPEPGETLADALHRELREELGAGTTRISPFTVVDDVAALELVPMRMTVYLADLDAEPRPAAELSAITWTAGDGLMLAPAVRNHVLPRLAAAGLLPPRAP